mmetsp:Transcript_32271/g.97144  ORF Transcript_32271/g.97144 Transcript_32271/m.97144 type:complete len:445 (-) Transcript_32271:2203-3537(-)
MESYPHQLVSLLHNSRCFDVETLDLLSVICVCLRSECRSDSMCDDMIRSVISVAWDRAPRMGASVAQLVSMALFEVGRGQNVVCTWSLEDAFLCLFYKKVHLLRLPLLMLLNQTNDVNVPSEMARLCVCLSAFRALLRVGGTTRMVSANSQYFLRLYALNSRTCSFGSPESMKPDAFALFNLLTDTLAVVGHGVIPVQSDSCTKIAEIAFSCPISIKLLKNFALELRSSHGTAFHTFVYKLLSKMHRSGKTADRRAHIHHLCEFRNATLNYFASMPSSSLMCTLHQSRLVIDPLSGARHDNTDVRSFDLVCSTILERFGCERHDMPNPVANICSIVQLAFATCSSFRAPYNASSLEQCTQTMHLATWLIDKHSRYIATLECAQTPGSHHHHHSACLRILEMAVFIWLKQAITHGSVKRFQIHQIAVNALGTPRATTRLRHVRLS